MKNILILILLFVIVGCEKDDLNNSQGINELAIENKVKNDFLLKQMLLTTSVKANNGSLLLQSNNFFGVNTTSDLPPLLYNKQDRRVKSKSNISNLILLTKDGEKYGGANAKKTPNSDLKALYGSTVSLNPENSTNKNVTDDVYIPNLLSTLTIDRNTLEPGTIISWNVDSLNKNGVLFHISYDPKKQQHLKIAYDNQYRVTELFAVNDEIGSYTITASDLERFPDRANLDIRLVRGNISLNENGTSFVALTEASTTRPIVK